MPIGRCKQPEHDSRPLTKVALAMVDRALEILSSLRPRFKAGGGTDDQWDFLVEDLERDLMTQPHINVLYYMTWARKL
jgi:hypothetical protein